MKRTAHLSLGCGQVGSAELSRAVGKEAHFPGTARRVFAHLRPILGRVQPALIYAMRKKAIVTLHMQKSDLSQADEPCLPSNAAISS